MNFRFSQVSLLNSATVRPFWRSQSRICGYLRHKGSHNFVRSTPSEGEIRAAREWLQNLDANFIPRNICDISFSRSSGPGGQNVNKVNSKATLKIPLTSLLNLIPPMLHHEIRGSRYLADRTNNLVIQSDEYRKQSDNVEACFVKLRKLARDAAKAAIPGETSESQRERVNLLQDTRNELRLRSKKLHSSKKSSRRSTKYDD